MKQFDQTMLPFDVLRAVAHSIQFNGKDYILATIDSAMRYFERRHVAQGRVDHKSGYFHTLGKLYSFIAAGGKAPFSIFAEKGNSKLPSFVAFSSLPGVTCPGAGDCLQFCYSFKAWRTPMAFGRQAMNAYILRFHPQLIVDALDSLMAKKKFANGFTLRLYVDGDFSSVSDFALWQGILSERPTIKAYGYSKSFAEILAYANSGASFASNYVLNVSGGHNHTENTVKHVEALPITRGSFVAVPIAHKGRSIEHGNAEHRKHVQSATKAIHNVKTAFACPGQCNTCTSSGHACGSMKFKGITIGIAVH
jgi:hypothetical protein